jgi:hypothetical protein
VPVTPVLGGWQGTRIRTLRPAFGALQDYANIGLILTKSHFSGEATRTLRIGDTAQVISVMATSAASWPN